MRLPIHPPNFVYHNLYEQEYTLMPTQLSTTTVDQ
jgi:hypothetical protein